MKWIVIYRYEDSDDDYECEFCSDMKLINLISNNNVYIIDIVRNKV